MEPEITLQLTSYKMQQKKVTNKFLIIKCDKMGYKMWQGSQNVTGL